MVSFYKGKIPIIHRSLDEGWLRGQGQGQESYGCVPRDYAVDPVLMGDSPSAMKLYLPSEYDAVYDEQEEQESSLEHIYLGDGGNKPAFVNLNQNGQGYCWSYSTGHCIMLDRLKRNFPMIRLNPHATAAIIKKGRDEGGWCGLSCKFGREHGYAIEGNGPGQWPLHAMNLKYDTPALRANMALHKVDEDWYDFGRAEWDQHLAKQQIATIGLSNIPGALDFNRFGHSMCMMRYVRFEKGAWGPLVFNSWKDWGYHGLAVLAEMYPDNAIAVRSTTPSAA